MAQGESPGHETRFTVSTQWLSKHDGVPGLVLLDVRSGEEYTAGHLPGSVNAPFSAWTTSRHGLLLELPEDADLRTAIGSAGIGAGARVVVIGRADNPYSLADAARVADTLIYAGVQDAVILDGGYDKWAGEGRPLSREGVQNVGRDYRAGVDRTMFVSKDYVKDSIGRCTVIDARDPEVYFGVVQEPTATRPGHIPTARCLPAPWIWTADGTYRSPEELRGMAEGVAGADVRRETIVYCGVGGYAAAWWFVLARGLGYRNVRIYDGSAQEWSGDPDMPLVSFKWE